MMDEFDVCISVNDFCFQVVARFGASPDVDVWENGEISARLIVGAESIRLTRHADGRWVASGPMGVGRGATLAEAVADMEADARIGAQRRVQFLRALEKEGE